MRFGTLQEARFGIYSRGLEPQTDSHWAEHARRWQHVGALLRPCEAEIAHVAGSLVRHFSPRESARALLCGVTPELARLRLPMDMPLYAVDQSAPMISAVWPGDGPLRRALQGDWLALDLEDRSVDIALGDGCLTLLDFPNGHRRLSASLGRVLVPGGLFSIRSFCRPEPAESLEAVLDALFAKRIGNFHAFKWRLAMALHGDDATRGVHLADVWRTFRERCGGAAEIAQRCGYPIDEVLTIDNYREASASYSFATVAEVVSQFEAEFELIERWHGSYELSERCPLLLFRRR